ncbi:hypothetical protein PISMIDRAFT_533101 [Pisolithus microcarpus 441]|uniref:Uncharacterized protein n=1 Tax=Pisolithus microcarpus 441 TaxID=765257 RepID=A0A0C9YLA8_9AGAM|nr:hypothetical protein BKA83DRAFT_533101 [Pisolithus microcarpus]KIK11097.1 hypothetical protein PISMIDRAFT_533101 [Pisolithus microcarpus 441]
MLVSSVQSDRPSNSSIILTQCTSNSTSIRVRIEPQRDNLRRRFHVYVWVPSTLDTVTNTRIYESQRKVSGIAGKLASTANDPLASLNLSSPPAQLFPMCPCRRAEATHQLLTLPSLLRQNLTRQRSSPAHTYPYPYPNPS